jgi:hypothetical protein
MVALHNNKIAICGLYYKHITIVSDYRKCSLQVIVYDTSMCIIDNSRVMLLIVATLMTIVMCL